MSGSPPPPNSWFGPRDRNAVGLRLVEAPRTRPVEARPFPFGLAVVISLVAIAAGAVVAHFWILYVKVAVKGERVPVVSLHHVPAEQAEPESRQRVARPRPVLLQPIAPRVRPPEVSRPMQSEALVRPDLEMPRDEPYDPADDFAEAEQPFPVSEPEVAKSDPKPSQPKTTRRPSSKPKTSPKVVSRGVSRPAQVLRSYKGPYPKSAQKAGLEGRVVLSVQVRSDGRVGSVRVSKSSGHAILDSTAISAVKRWTFAAEMKNGKPVTSTVAVPFRYEL